VQKKPEVEKKDRKGVCCDKQYTRVITTHFPFYLYLVNLQAFLYLKPKLKKLFIGKKPVLPLHPCQKDMIKYSHAR